MRTHPKTSSLEVLILIALLAILAAIALPMYSRQVRGSRIAEATTTIGAIVSAARVHALEHEDAWGHPIWPTNDSGITSSAATQNFVYSLAGGGGDALETPLQVVAAGRMQMSGVIVRVTVPSISAPAAKPWVTGL